MNRYVIVFFAIIVSLAPGVSGAEIRGHIDFSDSNRVVIRFGGSEVGSVGDVAEVRFIMIDGSERLMGRWKLESVNGLLAVASPIEVFHQPGIGQLVVIDDQNPGNKEPQGDKSITFVDTFSGDGSRSMSSTPRRLPDRVEKEITLPDFIGLTSSKAAEIARASGFKPEFELGREINDTQKEGIIYQQIPPPDTPLEKGSRVTLLVPNVVAVFSIVPNVIGKSAKVASEDVLKTGLNPVFELGNETRDKSKEGFVYFQAPPSGTKVEAGSDVVVKIYSFVTASRKVPNLVGIHLLAAQRILQEKDLRSETNFEGAAPNRTAIGKVSRQNPIAGREIKSGELVKLWVFGDYVEAQPKAKTNVQPEQTANEYCSLGKSGFIYQPDHGYFVFRSREPRKITNTVFSREYQIIGDYAEDAVRKIQAEGKMELVSKGPLKNLCPHLAESCKLSSMNHADGSFFGDLCGK